LRDLVVTGDHGMVLDGLLINACTLVNGTTIGFVLRPGLPEFVTCYHVETKAHKVTLTEGAPGESFSDVAGRKGYSNYCAHIERFGTERLFPEVDLPRNSTSRLLPTKLRARLGLDDPVLLSA